ncbi:MAG TPA: gas vesicle protein [Kribbella sp.]|nr:gas vesicle protein [Kribbella sp.]
MATPRKTTSRTAKKASPRKTTAPREKAAAARKPAAPRTPAEPPRKSSDETSQPAGNGRTPMRQVVLRAAGELQELIGRDPESVVGVERVDDDWKIHVEVVESQRIPDTTSILAVYEVLADSNGSLMSYRRSARYVRGKFEEQAGS